MMMEVHNRMEVTFEMIKAAQQRLANRINRTYLVPSQTFSNISGSDVYIKPEHLQKTGSFKIRGAYNKIANLTEQQKNCGVIAASAGNHAQGVALAASEVGVCSTVVMPETTPLAKITATKSYGAKVVLCGSSYDDAFEKAKKIQQEKGLTFVHAFNDPYIIAGQGTVGLEILHDIPDIDAIIVPIGGGGIIAGIAIAAKTLNPKIKVIGVEVESFDSMRRSVEAGKIIITDTANTIADGIAVKTPGDITFEIVNKYVDDIKVVNEDEIAHAILMYLERAKYVVEGAGAASLAALIHYKINLKVKKVAIVATGGNIDTNLIAMIIDKGLVKGGRKVEIKTILQDRPGQLKEILSILEQLKVNIVSVVHNREKEGLALGDAEVDMVLETRDREHAQKVQEVLKEKGYRIVV
ncbi:MAG: threonine dehydratase [Clostridiales bacterium]|jgi:threonine dehydratase|nr:threonine dehydratase [Clostridiales bacterium]